MGLGPPRKKGTVVKDCCITHGIYHKALCVIDAPLITAKLIKRRQKMRGKSRDTGFLKVCVVDGL